MSAHHPLPGWGYQEIGWLLEQVRESGGAIPERYDSRGDNRKAREARTTLASTIRFAFTAEMLARELTSDKKASKRLDALGRLEGQLSRALAILDAEPTLAALLASKLPPRPSEPGLEDIVAGMGRLRVVAARAGSERGAASAPLNEWNVTPQEALLTRLAEAYRVGLDADPIAGTVRRFNNFGGPFPAFLRGAYHLQGWTTPEPAALTKSVERYILRLNDKD